MRHLAVATVAAGLACAAGSSVEPGREFTLRAGETVTVTGLSLVVRFAGVPQDSRCPSRAECVWAGDAFVVVEATGLTGDSRTDTLHTNPGEGPETMDLGSTVLRLVRLDPYPEFPGEIEPGDYRARFVTEARQQPQPAAGSSPPWCKGSLQLVGDTPRHGACYNVEVAPEPS